MGCSVESVGKSCKLRMTELIERVEWSGVDGVEVESSRCLDNK